LEYWVWRYSDKPSIYDGGDHHHTANRHVFSPQFYLQSMTSTKMNNAINYCESLRNLCADLNGDGLEKRVWAAVEVLEALALDKTLLASLPVESRTRLFQAAGQVYCPDPIQRRRLLKTKRRLDKAARTQRDENVRLNTGIRVLRRRPVFNTPNVSPPTEKTVTIDAGNPGKRDILEPQHCYICKRDYSTIHVFYDQLCPACADLNFRKRTELADLRGRVAVLTGGRVKIGYQAGIKLLRAGAHLIVTTRFPRDSATR
jgi:hypothetical protein